MKTARPVLTLQLLRPALPVCLPSMGRDVVDVVLWASAAFLGCWILWGVA